MTMPYYDKNGNEIKAGMYLKMEDGEIERIYDCLDPYDGKPDLGINASNEEFLHSHYFGYEEAHREYYSLGNFDLSKAEICQVELTETAELKMEM